MSRHPFTDEDIEAALSMFGTSSAMSDEGFAEDILRAAWESAVARGAVTVVSNFTLPIPAPTGYFIELPLGEAEDGPDVKKPWRLSHGSSGR